MSQLQTKMVEANKPPNFKIFILCSKGSLGPSLQPVFAVQSIVDTRHRNLLVEIYNDAGDLQNVVKYDAVYDEEGKIKARKEIFKDKFGEFLTAAEARKRWPDCQIEELDSRYAESFSLDHADAYLEEVNTLDAVYNPVTDNCQEFVDELLCAASGCYGPVSTVGDQLKSTVIGVLRIGTLALAYILLLVSIMIGFSFAIVYFDLPVGNIWVSDILNDVEVFIKAFHYALWFYVLPNVCLYFYPAISVLSAIYATITLLVKFYSCDGAELLEQWSGFIGFEGCWFGYLLSLCILGFSIVMYRICDLVLIWVPPGVTFTVAVILLLVFHPDVTLRLLDDAFGFNRLSVQTAQSFAEDVGRNLMR